MTNVIDIWDEEGAPRVADHELVAMLEEILERAKAGLVVGAAVAFVTVDGKPVTRWAARHFGLNVGCAIGLLHHEYFAAWFPE